jgi:hypothetical protein
MDQKRGKNAGDIAIPRGTISFRSFLNTFAWFNQPISLFEIKKGELIQKIEGLLGLWNLNFGEREK